MRALTIRAGWPLGLTALALLAVGCADAAPAAGSREPAPEGTLQQTAAPAGAQEAVPIPAMEAEIWDPDDAFLLENFLLEHCDAPALRLDLVLSDPQVVALGSAGPDRLWFDLTYEPTYDEDEPLRGSELVILLAGPGVAQHLRVDTIPGESRVHGHIAVQEVRGPEKGLVTITARPVRP